MTLPGYAAAASLYTTSRSYRTVRSGPVGGDVGATVIAQHDPCDRGGGGGVVVPSGPCPRGQKCCGGVVNGRCLDQCVPMNADCP